MKINLKAVVLMGLGLLISLFFVFGLTGQLDTKNYISSTVGEVKEARKQATRRLSGSEDFNVDQDTPGYENYQKLRQGCPVKDCIPAIDAPVFETVEQADQWLKDDDIVFGLESLSSGETKVYPQRILNWHEIINDELEGEPISITFCPLCGSAIAFERRVGEQILDFGVSGKLHNSDLVMYDRQTMSLWQQISGQAIVGQLFETKLVPVQMDTLRWSDWKATHPNTQVLSRETGYTRDYDVYPYGSYESNPSVFFPIEGGVDDTLFPKEVVFGIELNSQTKAYPLSILESSGEINDTLGGIDLKITYNNGQVAFVRQDTSETVVASRLFWFAWKAFNPDTQIYE